jgi:uncharacterized membrane protein YdjX (TVP38/TMEM64 family)
LVNKSEDNGNLFFYLLSLRLNPIIPGWAMNLLFPHIEVNPLQFISTTLLGLAPWNFLICSAGESLSEVANGTNPIALKHYLYVINQ